jgi:hypothetical protein
MRAQAERVAELVRDGLAVGEFGQLNNKELVSYKITGIFWATQTICAPT